MPCGACSAATAHRCAGAPVHTLPMRASRIDPYRPFMLATLTKFPTLTAANLYAMVLERGYVG